MTNKLTLLIALCTLCLTLQTSAQTTLIRAGRFYDAEKNTFLDKQDVLIEGGKVKAVGPQLKAPEGARILDLPNATVTPGLIDMHTHLLTLQGLHSENLAVDGLINSPERRVLRAAGFAQSYLDAGFTTIRDLGNSGYYLDKEVSSAIGRGYIPGPRMICSGPIISAIDGQFYQLPFKDYDRITAAEYRVVKSVDDAILAVKEHVNHSAGVIKIASWGERLGLSKAETEAIVKTAHEYHLTVTAHANFDGVIRDAVLAGVDGIEHGYDISDSTLALMAKRKVYLVPTDVSIRQGIEMMKARNMPADSATVKAELQPLGDRLRRAQKAGVMIVGGSDAYIELSVTRGDYAKETIASYVEQGFSVKDALRTSTWNAAKALGQEGRTGVIKPGVAADIVIFNGDLEKDFSKVLFDVHAVFKDGKVVSKSK